MGDDPDTTWMTYEDAGRALNIKADSVRRRAAARKWPRRQGNDGLARVGIPSNVIPDDIPVITGDDPDASGRVREKLAAARAEADGLRDRLADAHAERDRLAGLLEAELARSSEPRPSVGLLERLFGRR